MRCKLSFYLFVVFGADGIGTRRVLAGFNRIDAHDRTEETRRVLREIRITATVTGCEIEVIAIDGKALRR
ncbi:MAG: hypothetical protein ABGX16_17010 [Pirellulales bacterium]